MLADTEAIRAFGRAGAGHTADLTSLAATASTVPGAAAATALGPVGTRFLAALADAVGDVSRAVAALGDNAATVDNTSAATAAAYDEADRRTGARFGAPAASAG
jgi:hypothetical protein